MNTSHNNPGLPGSSYKNPKSVNWTENKTPVTSDLAVVIGRFQFQHNGHAILFDRAAKTAKNLLILIGSSCKARDPKDPLTFEERKLQILQYMISRGYHTDHHISIKPLVDNPYSDTAWITQVQKYVDEEVKVVKSLPFSWDDRTVEHRKECSVCLVGNKKDASSYYLDLFPQYRSVYVDEFKLNLSSSDIRNMMFEKPEAIEIVQNLVPPHMYTFILEFMKTDTYAWLKDEFDYYKGYKEDWAGSPHTPMFFTKDFVIVKNGHVLLVQRKDLPGKGLWAMPGGFLKPRERIKGSTSEAFEETSIDLPPGLFSGSVVKSDFFDHPDRSLRGRVITHVDLVALDGRDNKPGLPKVKAADDAKDCKWFTFSEFLAMPEQMFEDHYSIIKAILGLE